MDAQEVIEMARAEILNEQFKTKTELVKRALIEVDRCTAELKKAREKLDELAGRDVETFDRSIGSDYWVTGGGCSVGSVSLH